MAELAAAASILSIADVGLRLSVKLLAFAETVANADKAIVVTSKDVSLTSSVLKEVAEVLKKDQPSCIYSPDAIKTATAIVTECSHLFQEMERVLVEKVPNISARNKESTSRTLRTLERFKWSYWQPKLQLLRGNLDRLRSTLLVMLNVIIYQRLLSAGPDPIVASQTTLIRDLIKSKEEYIQKYEKLKCSVPSGNPTPRALVPLESSQFNPGDCAPTPENDEEKSPSIADLCQEKETNLAWKHHLLSLFDRLIEEVDKSTYYIGLLSRYRIRSHIYTARSDEVAQILGDKGKAMTDGLSNIRFAAPNRPLIHRQRLGTGHGFLKSAVSSHLTSSSSEPQDIPVRQEPSYHELPAYKIPIDPIQSELEDLLALWTPVRVEEQTSRKRPREPSSEPED